MYRPEVRHRALALIDSGHSLRSVSMSTGINRSTLRDWRDHPEKNQRSRASCPRCADVVSLPTPCADYAYLLGLYLGDGCISRASDRNKDVWKLRIFCADAWPGLTAECVRAMRAIRPDNKIFTVQKQGCTEVLSTSRHWPCLFPQHGAGKKHLRRIELAQWQQVIVERYPGKFVRGLMHSDGYRGLNRVRQTLETGERRIGVPAVSVRERVGGHPVPVRADAGPAGGGWRFSKPNTISVAKRDAVARLDEFVGPKY